MVVRAATYRANSTTNLLGEVEEHVHRRVEPVHEPVIVGPRLVRIGDLFSKRGEDTFRRIAGFEPAKGWI